MSGYDFYLDANLQDFREAYLEGFYKYLTQDVGNSIL